MNNAPSSPLSFYAEAVATHGTQTTLADVLNGIRSGAWAQPVAAVRAAYATGGKDAARPLKKLLPGVTFSGSFTRRRASGLANGSGLLCADLDGLGERLPEVRAALVADARTVAVFVSPSGDGLKVVLRCDPARPHLQSFHAARIHVQALTGEAIDEACKDVSRLCFVSHDPDALIASDFAAVVTLDYPLEVFSAPTADGIGNAEGFEDEEQNWSPADVAELLRSLPPRPAYDRWLRTASAVWSVLDDATGREVLAAWSPEEVPGEYAEKHAHRLAEVGIGSLIYLARESGWKPSLAFRATLPDVVSAEAGASPICFDGSSYWRLERDGRFGRLGREDVKLHLKMQGLSARIAKGATSEVSQVDAAIHEIQRGNRVTYAAPFCGRSAGLYQENGNAVLATDSPHIIAPAPGDPETLESFFRNLFGEGIDPHAETQFAVFVGWLQRWRRALAKPGQHLPGQALFLIGPAGCGKSFAQTLLTELSAGRSADPSLWMFGRSDFNGELWGAEHLAMSDANVEDSYAARRILRDSVKRIVANPDQLCHHKNRGALTLRPIWRLTVSANPDADSSTIIPPLDESTGDKVVYLKCYLPAQPFPTESEEGSRAFLDSLRAAMPAFLDAVEGYVIPEHLRGGRFGVREWHHPEIKEALVGVHPDADAAGMIDDWLHGCLEMEMTGTASNIYKWIETTNHGSVAWVRACRSAVAFGQLLGRLAKLPVWRDRISKAPGHAGTLVWTLRKAPESGGVG